MDNTELELRVQRLEQRVNRYRLTSLLLGLGLIGLAGIAANAPQGTSQEIRTHKIVVVDEQGREAVHLLTGVHGGVLNLLNTGGFPVVRAGASDKGGTIALADAKGAQYMQMTAQEAGGELLITDKSGQKSLMKATAGAGGQLK